jgi:tetratricopeptide (TPR) repeat protein
MVRTPARQRFLTSAAGGEPPLKTSTIALTLRPNDTELAGAAASPSALSKLESALAELKAIKIAPYLERAMAALRKEDAESCCTWALKALDEDERSGFAWRLLGIGREMTGDFANAMRCYESALALTPEDVEIANDLGRLAYTLDMKPLAGKLFAHFWRARPESPDGANNFACVLRDEGQFDQAVEVLKAALAQHPEHPQLWNTLATAVTENGDPVTAITFFDEALRLDPDFAKARYNRGNSKLALGDFTGALTDCEAAMTRTRVASDLAMMKMARSTIKLCLNRIGEGWDDYESRLDPKFAGVTLFAVERPKWSPGDDIAGKSMLVMGEQGLGDEVLFANVIPDVIEAIGQDGTLAIAVEPRLIPLFQRSFPSANVGQHITYKIETHVLKGAAFVDNETIDLWAPMGSLLRQYRRTEDAFPKRARFLVPDEARVAHWREALDAAPAGPKIGLLWKSMIANSARSRHFSPFEQWAPVLRTPGVSFVNLQYGDCAEELAHAKAEFGVDIWQPPGIDLKQDLDDLAALSCAMDRIVGFSNATTNIAAACGAPVWMIASRSSWTRLGAENYPWYPQVRMFDTPMDGDWDATMSHLAAALAKSF